MKKELLIFGSNGALGKGVTTTLAEKDYAKIYLFFLTKAPLYHTKPQTVLFNRLTISVSRSAFIIKTCTKY